MNSRVAKSIASLKVWQLDAAGAAVVCVGAALWYFAGYEPLSQARATREHMEQELHDHQDAAEKQMELLTMRESILAKVRAENSVSAVQLKPAERVNQQVSDLTGVAGDAGLRVDEIRPASAMPAARFTMVPIKVSGAGEYAAVTEFLRLLRADFRDTGVIGFSLKMPTDATATGLKFEFNLVWYAAPSPSSAKKTK